ncbi:MAG: Flagellar hook-length control protein FliK [Firmicutes bacterium]|nr:Flagellar hook-length control protein FliK [Bacillota bacterium]
MNIALNLLPTNSTTAQVSSAKNASSVGKKTSFSDTLNKAVAKADEATFSEQEQSSVEDAANLPVNNQPGKKGTAPNQNQASTDQEPLTDAAAVPEESAQDALTSITTALAVNQIPLTAPSAAVQNEQLTAAAEQTVTAITAVPNVSALASSVLATTISLEENGTGSNSKSNQNPTTLTNLVQAGQAAPEMLDKLAGSITEVVTGSNTEQVSPTQMAANSQSQAQNAEALNQNTTFLSQLTASMQEQTANTAVAQNSNGTNVMQAVAGQNQALNAETANSKPVVQEQQLTLQNAIPAVEPNQQQESLNANLNNEGQEEGTADATTLKAAQDIPNKGVELTNSSMFAQNLEATLVASNGVTSSAKTAEAPTQATTDAYHVVDQIVEQTKIITKQQNTEMIMKLKPEHLGELTLKVVVENGAVNASFHSNNPEVRSLIEASLPQLKQELASTGLKVDNVSVYAGLGQFQPNQEQDRSSQQQLAKFTNKKSADDFIEAVEGELAGATLSGNGSQSGVDYRI